MKTLLKIHCLVGIALTFSAMPGFSEELSQSQCEQRGGRVVSTKCRQGKDLGAVIGIKCQCRCCTGEKLADCDKERFRVAKICTTANELRVTLRCDGNSSARGLQFNLESRTWHGSIEMPKATLSCSHENVAVYESVHKNRHFNRLTSVRAFFDDAVNTCEWKEDIDIRACSDKP